MVRRAQRLLGLLRPRRRWAQFTVRGLLVLLTLCAVAMGLWRTYLRPYYRQKAAIEELRKLGVQITTEPAKGPRLLGWLIGEKYFVEVTYVRNDTRYYDGAELKRLLYALERLPYLKGVNCLCGAFTDEDFANFVAPERLEHLSLRGGEFRGDGLRFLAEARGLRTLQLENCPNFGDDGMACLANHPNLTYLRLNGTGITDREAAVLARMGKLEHLDLRDTSIGDVALKSLTQSNALEELNVAGTRVSNEGLKSVANLPNLNFLYLWSTAITPEGFEHFSERKRRIALGLDGTQIAEDTLSYWDYLPTGTGVLFLKPYPNPRAVERVRAMRRDLSLHGTEPP